jgi:hypothetical protein
VEQHRVEEVYWVGGEPLMYEQHWRYMKRIVELGDGPRVYARYNTNLSRVDYRGVNLYRDILSGLRDWQICASLDGTGSQLVNTLEQALSMIAGLSILVKQLRSNVTDVKYELTLRSLCPECSKLHVLDNLPEIRSRRPC